jgi:casein kinase 1
LQVCNSCFAQEMATARSVRRLSEEFVSGSLVCDGKFRIVETIGEGSFGCVFDAVDVRNGSRVAIKVEDGDADLPALLYEHNVMNTVLLGVPGIPRPWYFGSEHGVNLMVMDRLGVSVEAVRRIYGAKAGGDPDAGRLPMDLLGRVARQALLRLRDCHARGVVHRDVKPDNLVFGAAPEAADAAVAAVAPAPMVYLIDFGLAKTIFDAHGNHIACYDKKKMLGTPRFASVNTHAGLLQSRRDDVEALGYVLVFLAHGRLPWCGIRAADDAEKLARVEDRKRAVDVEGDLCADLPPAFAATILHARALAFEAMPDYELLASLWAGVGRAPRPHWP